MAVEPGFFRTDLLDAHNAKYAGSTIEDYAAEGKAEDALAVVKPALEARLEELRAYGDLSKSTDGSFCA